MRISSWAILLLLAIGTGSLGGCGGSSGEGIGSLAGVSGPVGGVDDAVKMDTASASVKPDGKVSKHKKKAGRKAALSKKANASAYLIGAQDVLDITVFRVPELSKTIQVAGEGTVNLPLVGEIQAEGRTARQLEQTLTRKLGAKYLRNPQVTVYVKEFNSRRVTVNGAVKKPGIFPIRGKMTLISLIAQAGGLDEAAESTIVVFRDNGGKRKAAKFDIGSIKSGAIDDPVIRSGDVIVVGHSAIKAAYNNMLKIIPVVGRFIIL